MKDNVSIVFAVLFGVLLLVILPLVSVLDRQDSMAYNVALKLTTEFVNEVRNKGFIDNKSYTEYITRLGTTGVLYDVKMEAYKKKAIIADNSENEEEITYKQVGFVDNSIDILNSISNKSKPEKVEGSNEESNVYLLNMGDEFYISIYNKSVSSASIIYRYISGVSDTKIIDIKYGGVVNKINWELYEQVTNLRNNPPKIIMGVPKNLNDATPIVSYYETDLVTEENINKKLYYEYLFDITNYDNIESDSETDKYAYGAENTNEFNNKITMAVRLEEDSELNIDDIESKDSDEIKTFIKDKISLSGIYANIDIVFNKNNYKTSYYTFTIVLTEIKLDTYYSYNAPTNILIKEGLSRRVNADGLSVLSEQTESVVFTIYDSLGVHGVSIEGPFIANTESNLMMQNKLIYANVDIYYKVEYTRIGSVPNYNEILENIIITSAPYAELEIIPDKYYPDSQSGNFKIKFRYEKISEYDEFLYENNNQVKLTEGWTILEDGTEAKAVESEKHSLKVENSTPTIPRINTNPGGKLINGNMWYNTSTITIGIDATDDQSGIGKYTYELLDADNNEVIKSETSTTPFKIETNIDKNIKIKIIARAYDNTYDNPGANDPSKAEMIVFIDRTLPNAASQTMLSDYNVSNKRNQTIDYSNQLLYDEYNNQSNFPKEGAIVTIKDYLEGKVAEKVYIIKEDETKYWLINNHIKTRYIDGSIFDNKNNYYSFYLKIRSGSVNNIVNESGFNKTDVILNESTIASLTIPKTETTIIRANDSIKNGKNTIKTRTYDKVGNYKETEEESYYIDRIMPYIELTCDKAQCKDGINEKQIKTEDERNQAIGAINKVKHIYIGTALDLYMKVGDTDSGMIYSNVSIKKYNTATEKYETPPIFEFIGNDGTITDKKEFGYKIKESGQYLIEITATDLAQNTYSYKKEIAFQNISDDLQIYCGEYMECTDEWYNQDIPLTIVNKKGELFPSYTYIWKKNYETIIGATESVYTVTQDTNVALQPYDMYSVSIATVQEDKTIDFRTIMINLRKDSTPPIPGLLILRHNNENGVIYEGGWTKNNIYVSKMDGTDTGSSHKSTKLKLNNNIIESTAGYFILERTGKYVVKTLTEDIAKNTAESQERLILIDKSPPLLTLKNPTPPPAKYSEINIILEATDFKMSGLNTLVNVIKPDKTTDTVSIVENNLISKEAVGTYTATTNGTYTFTLSDNAGNTMTRKITIENIE